MTSEEKRMAGSAIAIIICSLGLWGTMEFWSSVLVFSVLLFCAAAAEIHGKGKP